MSEWRRAKLSKAYVISGGFDPYFPEAKNILWTARTVPNLKDLPVKCMVSAMFILVMFYLYKLI